MDTVFFWLLAAVAIGASLLVIAQRNPMYSVLVQIVSFGALAGLYVLLDAPFVAVTQIIIYAGAIMVLFLFVVMLLNVPTEDPPTGYHARLLGAAGPRRFGAVLSGVLLLELVWAIGRMGDDTAMPGSATGADTSSVKAIGMRLFDPQGYAFAFEATSVLILVAMVGAIVLARREQR
jgi:NADH-quinone oxidoreductase subunit J